MATKFLKRSKKSYYFPNGRLFTKYKIFLFLNGRAIKKRGGGKK